jgi:hypothetical protein
MALGERFEVVGTLVWHRLDQIAIRLPRNPDVAHYSWLRIIIGTGAMKQASVMPVHGVTGLPGMRVGSPGLHRKIEEFVKESLGFRVIHLRNFDIGNRGTEACIERRDCGGHNVLPVCDNT